MRDNLVDVRESISTNLGKNKTPGKTTNLTNLQVGVVHWTTVIFENRTLPHDAPEDSLPSVMMSRPVLVPVRSIHFFCVKVMKYRTS